MIEMKFWNGHGMDKVEKDLNNLNLDYDYDDNQGDDEDIITLRVEVTRDEMDRANQFINKWNEKLELTITDI